MEQVKAPRYGLTEHVRACRVSNHVYLIDLKRDRYLGAEMHRDSMLGKWIEGWPREEESDPAGGGVEPSVSDTELVEQMLRDGVIAHKWSFEIPCRALLEGYYDERPAIFARDIVRFGRAVATAGYLLRFTSLEQIASRVSGRRATADLKAGVVGAECSDVNALRDQVVHFERLRPMAFTSANKCLFNSLALLEFLSQVRMYPIWIFGVKRDPFGAHCWLQVGDIVVNDIPENVGLYHPIMTL